MAYTLSDKNFENLKKSFKIETGLDANSTTENKVIYIAYYQAKMVDTQTQLLSFILTELGNKR